MIKRERGERAIDRRCGLEGGEKTAGWKVDCALLANKNVFKLKPSNNYLLHCDIEGAPPANDNP